MTKRPNLVGTLGLFRAKDHLWSSTLKRPKVPTELDFLVIFGQFDQIDQKWPKWKKAPFNWRPNSSFCPKLEFDPSKKEPKCPFLAKTTHRLFSQKITYVLFWSKMGHFDPFLDQNDSKMSRKIPPSGCIFPRFLGHFWPKKAPQPDMVRDFWFSKNRPKNGRNLTVTARERRSLLPPSQLEIEPWRPNFLVSCWS